MDYGIISAKVERIDSPYAISVTHFDWHGPPIAQIDWPIAKALPWLETAKRGFIGPYEVEVINYEFVAQRYTVRRVDSLLGRWLAMVYRATLDLQTVKARTIVTLAVWGLADWRPGLEPRWRDVRAIRRLLNLVRGVE